MPPLHHVRGSLTPLALALSLLALPVHPATDAEDRPLLWPLPRQHTMHEGAEAGAFDAQAFAFKAAPGTAPGPSAILSSAFERYRRIIIGSTGAGTGAGTGTGTGAGARLEALEVHIASASTALTAATSENHTLTIAFPAATLHAATVFAALRGIELFAQIVGHAVASAAKVRAQTVVDWPRFPHRGIMIDSSRHFLPIPAVLRFVEAMAFSKLNVLHWHLTDAQSFPVQSAAFPGLANGSFSVANRCRSPINPMPNETHHYKRAPPSAPPARCTYSHADLKAVVAFATQHGVRVVPEFDSPAHAASWGKSPETAGIVLDCDGKTDYMNVLDPVANQTFDVLRGFLGEMAAIFPDEQMHLGMDEVLWTCFNTSRGARQRIAAAGRQLDDDGFKFLLREYVRKVQGIVGALGKRSTVWQEALDKYGPGNHGPPFGRNTWLSVNTGLARNTTVQLWKDSAWYDTDNGMPITINVSGVLALGHSVLLSGPWYLSEGTNWPSGYTSDPATNKSCTYAKQEAQCVCMEEGNVTNTTGHPSGGCYDIADSDPLFKRVLGGEACIWGEDVNETNIHLAAWPGGLAVAERLWSAREVNNASAATPRVLAQMQRLRQRGIPVRGP